MSPRPAIPNAAITYNLGNGSITADQRSIVDAGFLELVRLGDPPRLRPRCARLARAWSISVIGRQTIRAAPGSTATAPMRTGSEDGYGDCFEPDSTSCSPTGAPWPPTDSGSGHLWPVLSGERGEYDVAAGHPSAASTLLGAMRRMTSGGYLEPEQAWEDPALAASPYGIDPATASIGFAPGQPGRLGQPAHLGPGPVRAPGAGARLRA